jgi:hypothetical protein
MREDVDGLDPYRSGNTLQWEAFEALQPGQVRITLNYSNNEHGPEQATLVQNAIDSKVSGIAVTLSNADAVVPVAKKAVGAGICPPASASSPVRCARR